MPLEKKARIHLKPSLPVSKIVGQTDSLVFVKTNQSRRKNAIVVHIPNRGGRCLGKYIQLKFKKKKIIKVFPSDLILT